MRTTIPKKKLTDDDALALVLSGLKGEAPISDLCRKYGVSTATDDKLRDQFIVGGVQELQNNGKTNMSEKNGSQSGGIDKTVELGIMTHLQKRHQHHNLHHHNQRNR